MQGLLTARKANARMKREPEKHDFEFLAWHLEVRPGGRNRSTAPALCLQVASRDNEACMRSWRIRDVDIVRIQAFRPDIHVGDLARTSLSAACPRTHAVVFFSTRLFPRHVFAGVGVGRDAVRQNSNIGSKWDGQSFANTVIQEYKQTCVHRIEIGFFRYSIDSNRSVWITRIAVDSVTNSCTGCIATTNVSLCGWLGASCKRRLAQHYESDETQTDCSVTHTPCGHLVSPACTTSIQLRFPNVANSQFGHGCCQMVSRKQLASKFCFTTTSLTRSPANEVG